MYYEKFEEILNEINWNEKLDHLNDVDEICEQFTKYFLKIAKESIPTKIVDIRNNDRSWVNNELTKYEEKFPWGTDWEKMFWNVDIKLYKKTTK